MDEEGIGQLFGRLIDDGGTLVRAELEYQRQVMIRRLTGSRTAIYMIAGAFLLVQAGVVVLLIGLVGQLARLIGPMGAGFVVALLAFGVAGLLLHLALGRLKKVADNLGEAAK